MLKQERKAGFTLIELLVVIGIMSVLTSVIIASLSAARKNADNASQLNDVAQLKVALRLYYQDYGGYPICDDQKTTNSGSSVCCIGSKSCYYGGLTITNNSLTDLTGFLNKKSIDLGLNQPQTQNNVALAFPYFPKKGTGFVYGCAVPDKTYNICSASNASFTYTNKKGTVVTTYLAPGIGGSVNNINAVTPIPGCTDSSAFNYDPTANTSTNTCIAKVYGCTDVTASNYNPSANIPNNSTCTYVVGGGSGSVPPAGS